MAPAPVTDRQFRRQLRLAQGALLCLLAGTAMVGHRIAGWPLMTWTMYTRRTTPSPLPASDASSRVSAVELRVGTRSGRLVTIAPVEFFTIDRISAAELAIASAFDEADPASRKAHRRYLATVVRQLLRGEEPATIEGWRIEWAVDPLALPPLDRRRPLSERRLGGFSATDPAPNGAGR